MWGEESTILKLIVPEISIFAYQKLILGTPVPGRVYRMIMYKFLCGGKNTNITSYIPEISISEQECSRPTNNGLYKLWYGDKKNMLTNLPDSCSTSPPLAVKF